MKHLLLISSLLFSSSALSVEQGEDENTRALQESVDFSPFVDADAIPDNVEELLSTDTLPDMTPEMALQYLLKIAPEKPEWIFARKMLEEQVKAVRAKKVKKYVEKNNQTIIPYGVQAVEGTLSLEPFKFSTLSFIDAAGTPWPVISAKPSNSAFTILEQSEFENAAGLAPNTIIIRSVQDYSDANLIVYLKDYGFPLLIKLQTGSTVVESVRTMKVMSSAPVDEDDSGSMTAKEMPLYSSAELRAFLIEPPSNAKIIPVKGDGVEVFQLDNDYFVVTRFQINVPYEEVEFGNGDQRVYKVGSESMLDTLTFTHKGELISFDVMLEG